MTVVVALLRLLHRSLPQARLSANWYQLAAIRLGRDSSMIGVQGPLVVHPSPHSEVKTTPDSPFGESCHLSVRSETA